MGSGDALYITVSEDNAYLTEHRIAFYLPPSTQINFGVASSDIICKDGLELIFKYSDNSPACVKQSTAEKLIQRGWITKPTIWVEHPTVQYGNEWDESLTQRYNDNPDIQFTSKMENQWIKEYFIEKGINVLEVKFVPDENVAGMTICEAESCPSGAIIMLKIGDPDPPLLNHISWKIS